MYSKTPEIAILKAGCMLILFFHFYLNNCSKQLKSFPVRDKANLLKN